MNYSVRIGTGTLEGLTVYEDVVDMPFVPREGETITIRTARHETRYKVLAVDYLIDTGKFLGARVLVEDPSED